MWQQITKHSNTNSLIPKNYHINRRNMIKSNRIKQLIQKIIKNYQFKSINNNNHHKQIYNNNYLYQTSNVISNKLSNWQESSHLCQNSLTHKNYQKTGSDSQETFNQNVSKQSATMKVFQRSCQFKKLQSKQKKTDIVKVRPLPFNFTTKRSVTQFGIYDAISKKTPTKFHPKCQHQVVRQYLKMTAIKELFDSMQKQKQIKKLKQKQKKKNQSDKTLPSLKNKIIFQAKKNILHKINIQQNQNSNPQSNPNKNQSKQQTKIKLKYNIKNSRNNNKPQHSNGTDQSTQKNKKTINIIKYFNKTINKLSQEEYNQINGWNQQQEHFFQIDQFIQKQKEINNTKEQTHKTHTHWNSTIVSNQKCFQKL